MLTNLRSLLVLISFLWASVGIYSQNINDAVRYSQHFLGGTARSIGVGNSMGALGADLSVLSTNPAGLAAFRYSEFIITPSVSLTSVTSRLSQGSNDLNESLTRFNFQNLGIVFAHRPRYGKFKTANIAFGVNRLADFYESSAFEGNSTGSITNRFLEAANGIGPDDLDQFESQLAYIAGAIYDFEGDLIYESDFQLAPEALTEKRQNISRIGNLNEMVLSFATNYNEKLMMGVTIGIPFASFEEDKMYEELDRDDNVPFFNALSYLEYLNTSGTGINGKLGIIYRVNQSLRLGLAFHSPSTYIFEDNYTTDLTYDYTDGPDDVVLTELSPEGNFEYDFTSPMQLIPSLGLIVGKKGFIGVEAEWIPYSKAKFRFETDPDYESELNSLLSEELKDVVNIKVGGEYVINPFRLRLGVNYFSNPYLEERENTYLFSLGGGVRWDKFFIDLGYRYQTVDDGIDYPYISYTESSANAVLRDKHKHLAALSIGVKF
jgi:hypothetical protein